MSVSASRVTVTTTATLIVSGPGTVFLVNEVSGAVIGNSSVTATSGLTLQQNMAPMQLDADDSIYGITASGTATVSVLKLS